MYHIHPAVTYSTFRGLDRASTKTNRSQPKNSMRAQQIVNTSIYECTYSPMEHAWPHVAARLQAFHYTSHKMQRVVLIVGSVWMSTTQIIILLKWNGSQIHLLVSTKWICLLSAVGLTRSMKVKETWPNRFIWECPSRVHHLSEKVIK